MHACIFVYKYLHAHSLSCTEICVMSANVYEGACMHVNVHGCVCFEKFLVIAFSKHTSV